MHKESHKRPSLDIVLSLHRTQLFGFGAVKAVVESSMSKLTHRLSTVPELGAVNLSVRNGKSAIQFRRRANATLITELKSIGYSVETATVF